MHKKILREQLKHMLDFWQQVDPFYDLNLAWELPAFPNQYDPFLWQQALNRPIFQIHEHMSDAAVARGIFTWDEIEAFELEIEELLEASREEFYKASNG
jgi:hypothetical protein